MAIVDVAPTDRAGKPAPPGTSAAPSSDVQIVYRTDRGVQYVGDSRRLLEALKPSSVDLIVTSPPFSLLRPKKYGNKSQAEYVSWLSEFGRLAKTTLKDSGSLVVEVGGAYQRGRPVRSIYNYRLLIEFCDALGYELAEEFFWFNAARLPSPIEWVNKRKIRAKDAVNPIWWFSKTDHPKADTRNVRVEYSPRMRELLQEPATFYKPGTRPSAHSVGTAFARDNGGALPSNLLPFSNTESTSPYLRACKALGVAPHPARFPSQIPRFFIRYLTDPGDTVVDIFSGSNTTGHVAEQDGRKWIACELDAEYARLSAVRFMDGWPKSDIEAAWEATRSGVELDLRMAKGVDGR